MRLDDLIRSERYFTATLFPLVLFHDGFRGLRDFLELVDERSSIETDASGKRRPRGPVSYEFSGVEVITEFHIARDLAFGGALEDVSAADRELGGERDRRDAPDVVIVAGCELVVCEGKFFNAFNVEGLNRQLASQRRQVAHLFRARPDLRGYRHVAILPERSRASIDADAVVTWSEICAVAARVMGESHYVTARLRGAARRYTACVGTPGVSNFDGRVSFDEMVALCRTKGDGILVGHKGGERNLRARGLAYARRKRWKWRDPSVNAGTALGSNWIGGGRFLRVVDALPFVPVSAAARAKN
jgi:hypothetical protein